MSEAQINDFWHLPKILSVTSSIRRFTQPQPFFDGAVRKELREIVEIMVRTDSSIPARALAPALYIGEVPIIEYEMPQPNLYRFVALDPQILQEGAVISFGWPVDPTTRVETKFRYHLSNRPIA